MVFGLNFLNTVGLFTLLALIPFILLYLIRPKPVKKMIPSLMFLLKDKQKSNFNAFLERLLRNILFLIQLFILLLLALTIAKPYINVSTDMFVQHAVIIVDGSASMQVQEGLKTRFEKAIDEAETHLGGANTIILATHIPQLLAEDEPKAQAKRELRALKPRATESNLYDAIMAAKKFTRGEQTKLVVISDFVEHGVEGTADTAKAAVEALGTPVEFIDIAEHNANNVGIIDVEVKDNQSTVWVKNFGGRPEEVQMNVGEVSDKLLIGPGEVELFAFTNVPGINELSMVADDDFSVDNKAFISTPIDQSIRILLITNAPSEYFTTALNLIKGVELEITNPPKVPDLNHDIIILHNFDRDLILPKTVRDIKQVTKAGGRFIITGQDDLFSFELGELLPVEPTKFVVEEQTTLISKVNDYDFMKDIDFGTSSKYLAARPRNNVVPLATTGNNATVMTYNKFGAGKIFYYGIIGDASDFRSDLYYPIFWKRVIDFLMENQNVADLNSNTGKILFLGETQEVKTPTRTLQSANVVLDEAGFYEFPTRTIATNLISEKESRVNKGETQVVAAEVEISEGIDRKKKQLLDHLFLYIIIGLLLLELFIVKTRGDL